MRFPPNRINSLMADKSKDSAGRQEDRLHIIATRTTVEMSSCPTRLQTPAPLDAKTSATLPEVSIETVSIQNLVRNLSDLSSRALCTTLREPRKKFAAIVAVRSRSCGSL